jgi:hypothetical protein
VRSGTIGPEMTPPGPLGVHLRELAALVKQAMDPATEPWRRLGLLVSARTELNRAEAAALFLARQSPTVPPIAHEGPSEAAAP